VTVSYATADGTATASEDYTAVNGTVTIPAGSTTATFSVVIAADQVDEAAETVLLSLSNPSGAALGAPSNATLTIVDDDTAGVVVNPTAVSVAEGGAIGTYTVVLASQPTSDVTITIATDGQTTVNPPALTFTPLDWNVPQAVTVSAVDDDVAEDTPHTGLISHTAASDDPDYDGVDVDDVTATIAENDFCIYLPLVTRAW
jgi:hypothetical protein